MHAKDQESRLARGLDFLLSARSDPVFEVVAASAAKLSACSAEFKFFALSRSIDGKTPIGARLSFGNSSPLAKVCSLTPPRSRAEGDGPAFRPFDDFTHASGSYTAKAHAARRRGARPAGLAYRLGERVS